MKVAFPIRGRSLRPVSKERRGRGEIFGVEAPGPQAPLRDLFKRAGVRKG